MATATISLQPFYGRQIELGSFRRALEGRTGRKMGFSGIGGIGKSTLLQKLYIEAQRLKITDYVVYLDLMPEVVGTTRLDLANALIAALESTGKTKQRRFFRTTDSLEHCKKVVHDQLVAQARSTVNISANVSAENNSRIGNFTFVNEGGVVPPQSNAIKNQELWSAFHDAVRNRLPSSPTMPPEHVVCAATPPIGAAG